MRSCHGRPEADGLIGLRLQADESVICVAVVDGAPGFAFDRVALEGTDDLPHYGLVAVDKLVPTDGASHSTDRRPCGSRSIDPPLTYGQDAKRSARPWKVADCGMAPYAASTRSPRCRSKGSSRNRARCRRVLVPAVSRERAWDSALRTRLWTPSDLPPSERSSGRRPGQSLGREASGS
jgi:hypothetical protein